MEATMGDKRLEEVVKRLERLEHQVRRWRRGAMALMLSAVALTTLAAAVPRGRTVEAQKFVLKDAAGRVRAELGPGDNNKSMALRFKDETSSPRLVLGVEDESALLVLNDKTGRPRVGLVTLAQGAPGFTFYDTAGRARVELGVSRDGEPRLAVRDARGGSAWKAP